MGLSNIYYMISIIAYILSGVCLLIAIVLFVKFNIFKTVGDFTGRNARKSIEQMRKDNEKSGVKSYRPSPVAVERGKLTDEIENSFSISSSSKSSGNAEALSDSKDDIGEATQLLDDNSKETQLLDNNETELLVDDQSTTLLNEETQLLSKTEVLKNLNNKVENFTIIQNIVLIHTDEEI